MIHYSFIREGYVNTMAGMASRTMNNIKQSGYAKNIVKGAAVGAGTGAIVNGIQGKSITAGLGRGAMVGAGAGAGARYLSKTRLGRSAAIGLRAKAQGNNFGTAFNKASARFNKIKAPKPAANPVAAAK